jgi:cell division protein ZapA (FtsZ GTPase activity inhibitor)
MASESGRTEKPKGRGARTISVMIAGQKFSLKSDAAEERVQAIAAHVDAKIREAQSRTRTADSQVHAVLAALQIAEALFDERDALQGLKTQVRAKGQALLAFLEKKGGV